MGSKEYRDESPPHAVFLDGYFLQQLEVTQAQYQLCVEAGACPEAASGEACNWGRDDRDDHPANSQQDYLSHQDSWLDRIILPNPFLKNGLGFRLPAPKPV